MVVVSVYTSGCNWGQFRTSLGNIRQFMETMFVVTPGGCYWHRVARGKGCCLASYSAQGSLTTEQDPAPCVKRAEVESICSRRPSHRLSGSLHVLEIRLCLRM